jgi:glutamate racemase
MSIGFFDSGSGGLSVLRAFVALAPKADIIYYGDTANAPYGTKNIQELERLAENGISFLKEAGATSIVAACNSVSPSILAFDAGDTPMIEMSLPTAQALKGRAGEHLLLMATPATISSKLYERATAGSLNISPLPIPALASAIENGASQDEIRLIVREAFATLPPKKEYDAIILGCTHYPLVRDVIESEAAAFFDTIEIIDPAEAVAREATTSFATDGSGKLAFHLSQAAKPFETRVAKLFPNRSYTVDIVDKTSIM